MILLSPRQVTYSPAYTLVPTYECFNRCTYCNFRVDPGQNQWLSLEEAERRLREMRDRGVIEILVLSGEVHPNSSRRSAWVQHIEELCRLAIALDLLPHTNAGPLGFEEMARLKTVNVSMGLMLEQLTPVLLQTVHRHAPSKKPELRLQQLQWAGELRIPFTTGLLLGIGEMQSDREETLRAIAHLHQQYGHIQEVILQPHSPGTAQQWQGEAFGAKELVETVAIARQILPTDITIQIPPNLIASTADLLACIAAGARDLGGIGPTDEVNPDYPHPHDAELAQKVASKGWSLVPRLPIYPHHDDWLTSPLRERVQGWRRRLQTYQSPLPSVN